MWKGVGDRTELQHIDPATLMAITVFLSRSGLLNRGPRGPASLRHVPHSSIFSTTGLISNWLNFLCTEFLRASQITLIQPVHCQGYILIFPYRMHLLFTQVHFLFWQLSRGQYVTHIFFDSECLKTLDSYKNGKFKAWEILITKTNVLAHLSTCLHSISNHIFVDGWLVFMAYQPW